ncbi:hypothetical protein APHAL10511_002793 [Amanita phalloides]|nr:hypothetical protein APHAL10511_002793 [Amanita phalloides]
MDKGGKTRRQSQLVENQQEKEKLPSDDESVDLPDLLDAESDDGDDEYDEGSHLKGPSDVRSTGINARSQVSPSVGASKHHTESDSHFRATPLSPIDSATGKTPDETHKPQPELPDYPTTHQLQIFIDRQEIGKRRCVTMLTDIM